MSKLFNPTLSVIAADMRLDGAISVGGIVKVDGNMVHEGGRVDGRLRMKTDEDCGTRSTGA